ncbi:MAG: peptidase [Cohaesibacter sp.]|jgi:putative iron-regulated protein|nr:peptidase [Cohaesibacter sp.]
MMKKALGLATFVPALMMTASAIAMDAKAVLTNYADIAEAGYEDSVITAKALDKALEALVASPTEENLTKAKAAWLAARVPYQQTEVYRFGNPIVDDFEGKVNAWPLDEGMIDYTDKNYYGTESDENALFTANVIANKEITINGEKIDAAKITAELLAEKLHEAAENEANVATGYHAIEFLLWGQDVNGTGKGAGTRPASDFDTKNCTGGNCDRRADYLLAASKLMISDLEGITKAWGKGGEARTDLMAQSDKDGLTRILTGMGSLSYGELAGERMKLGLLLNDPEEEHDCFSDNTHNSHYYDVKGIINVYNGSYKRVDGSMVKGASLKDLVSAADAGLAKEMSGKLMASDKAFSAMVERAETVEAYDQMIGEGNEEGNKVVQAAIDSLVDQTKSIERVIAKLDLGKIELEGSDSLDNPKAVFE